MKILVLFFMLATFLIASNISIIKVEGMHCPLCTTAVKKAIKDLDGIEKVSAILNTKEVTVIYNEKTNLCCVGCGTFPVWYQRLCAS